VELNVQRYVLSLLELELAIHVNNQNVSDHYTYLPFPEDIEMREVKDLAGTIRGTVAQLRTTTAQAKNRFAAEVAHTQASVAKVNSFSDEMAEANKEVDALLADAGSNFEPAQAELPGVTTQPKADSNGVTSNKAK
jgi:hypothetical protein